MAKATLVFRRKETLSGGIVLEIKIWRIQVSDDYPEGFKYSLFAAQDGKVLVGYDNHKPKSHHRHWGETEWPYTFVNLDKLQEDFIKDLEAFLNQGE